MMSLTKIDFNTLIKKQTSFKFRAYSGIFTMLIVVQAIGIFSSLLGGSSMSIGSSNVSLTVTFYSADQVIMLTMLWIFISSILLTTPTYRNDDFIFVSNRTSSNLANGLFLLTASIVGGLTSVLSGYLIKLIIRFFDYTLLPVTGLPASSKEFFSGVIASILIMVLLSSLGYFLGMIAQLHKNFNFILPILFFGLLYVLGSVGDGKLLLAAFSFYFAESSIILFIIKIVLTSVLLFISSVMISNRQEVR